MSVAMRKEAVCRHGHANAPGRLCNQSLGGELSAPERALMRAAAAQKIAELFDILRIDHSNDHNTRDTPNRVAKMLVEETLSGRYSNPPAITDFEFPACAFVCFRLICVK